MGLGAGALPAPILRPAPHPVYTVGQITTQPPGHPWGRLRYCAYSTDKNAPVGVETAPSPAPTVILKSRSPDGVPSSSTKLT